MIRLFSGLEIPADLTAALSLLRGGLPGAKWVNPDDYHITLQFAGNIDESMADELHMALSRIRKSAVEVILERISAFGGEKPRAIVVLARSTPSLLDLQGVHERAFRQIGIKLDGRKFVPHITLARLKGISAEAVAEFIDARGFFRPRIFVASSFELFSSGRSSGGGPYTVEARYPLA